MVDRDSGEASLISSETRPDCLDGYSTKGLVRVVLYRLMNVYQAAAARSIIANSCHYHSVDR